MGTEDDSNAKGSGSINLNLDGLFSYVATRATNSETLNEFRGLPLARLVLSSLTRKVSCFFLVSRVCLQASIGAITNS